VKRSQRRPVRREWTLGSAAVALAAALVYALADGAEPTSRATSDLSPAPPSAIALERRAPEGDGSAVARAFREQRSGLMVTVEGDVAKLLPDDRDGSRHQRFLLALDRGPTLLVAHNIDLASRVPLASGDRVLVRGQYEWNERGGVLHWTHRDPAGRHDEGFIEHAGRRYE